MFTVDSSEDESSSEEDSSDAWSDEDASDDVSWACSVCSVVTRAIVVHHC